MVGKTSAYRNCDRPTLGVYKDMPPDFMNNDTVSDRHSCKALCPCCIVEGKITKKNAIIAMVSAIKNVISVRRGCDIISRRP
ncbi:hypothetical protein [Microcoleus sp.]|uniref:hypothetical protein n=1 Tax=Microcoleus sp. TaxID=44472 RepID=UPI00403E553C